MFLNTKLKLLQQLSINEKVKDRQSIYSLILLKLWWQLTLSFKYQLNFFLCLTLEVDHVALKKKDVILGVYGDLIGLFLQLAFLIVYSKTHLNAS